MKHKTLQLQLTIQQRLLHGKKFLNKNFQVPAVEINSIENSPIGKRNTIGADFLFLMRRQPSVNGKLKNQGITIKDLKRALIVSSLFTISCEREKQCVRRWWKLEAVTRNNFHKFGRIGGNFGGQDEKYLVDHKVISVHNL